MSANSNKVAVIIVAAGRGLRMGNSSELPKQYQQLAGKPVLARTIEAFAACDQIDTIVPIICADHLELYAELALNLPKLHAPVLGGADRQQSVFNGLQHLSSLEADTPQIVLIHDAARPFVSTTLIEATIAAAKTNDGAIPALPVTDTLKFASPDQFVDKTISRVSHFLAQTPQTFQFDLIWRAHQQAKTTDIAFTDDASIAEWFGLKVKLVPGESQNYKLTVQQDFKNAEQQLQIPMETRVGTGFDVHAFEPGDHVVLGGIKIPHDAKLKGHSDADVGLHTLTDALYGAMADGDIGQHFPPSDNQWLQADSAIFLQHAVQRLVQLGGRLVHLDLTLICEAPKIGPHCAQMRERIAQIADISMSRVSVKATTTEKLGFTGRQEGIAAQAAVTIEVPVKE